MSLPQGTPDVQERATKQAEAISQTTRKRLVELGGFGENCALDPARARAKVRLAFQTTTQKNEHREELWVEGHLEIKPDTEAISLEHFQEDTEAVGIVPLSAAFPRNDQVWKTTETLSLDLVTAYLDRQKLWQATDAVLLATLGRDAGEHRLEAMAVAARRNLRQGIPRLLALLEDEDERVRDAALGALLQLREPQTVAVLTRKRTMRDSREMHKVIEVVAALGGTETLDYLTFVAENHDNEQVRQAAAKALQRIKLSSKK